jgi:hypothetical protein
LQANCSSRPALERVVLSESAAAMRHPLTRMAAGGASRLAAASAARGRAFVNVAADASKPLYEGLELLMERLDNPPCVVHAQVEGLPPRWQALLRRLR